MSKTNDDSELQTLKSSIGFKTAFKATMGFYVAQTVATLLGLLVISSLAILAALVIKFLAK